MNEAINGIENNVFEKIRREAAAKHRDGYDISTDIDDVIVGLERVLSCENIFQEAIDDELQDELKLGLINATAKSRLDIILEVFLLCRDRLFDETKHLKELNDELYTAYFELKQQRGGANNERT